MFRPRYNYFTSTLFVLHQHNLFYLVVCVHISVTVFSLQIRQLNACTGCKNRLHSPLGSFFLYVMSRKWSLALNVIKEQKPRGNPFSVVSKNWRSLTGCVAVLPSSKKYEDLLYKERRLERASGHVNVVSVGSTFVFFKISRKYSISANTVTLNVVLWRRYRNLSGGYNLPS
jgi:hypothetical protein